jgi:DNA-binding CsgD family transcriptional regulator
MIMDPGTPAKANVKTRHETTTTDMDGAGEPGGRALPVNERTVIAGVLALIALLGASDLLIDLREGVTAWHVIAEALVAMLACLGAFHLLRGAWRLRRRLEAQDRDFSAFRRQAEAWRTGSRKYLDGLSRSIDLQLDQWQLSVAEKDVAFLLLKGLSLKEIAAARGTTEKTARVQSSAVYAKSGLAGRSELSAFFLEDLLPPVAAAAAPGSDDPPCG